VPHISLVFREMWETANLDLFSNLKKRHVECCGLPHLAKNERDMGHPTILGREREKPLILGREKEKPLIRRREKGGA
jgi:hypothetical protein